ncbi:CNNM domain-containing protein [Algisphaera agarilytica]|uniref:CBS domain containing-hemolysin-like protein n=1 Tax=Algisphaera agarilytica TaxID=1385975 RepID=A0A7X0LLD5_9BACT|nr:CNNM domain-containing protein [Algisphaera agarilytica]MBB6430799.1 CBS domain containing-hemolysin-like protein [Algisphaera agarilytica]
MTTGETLFWIGVMLAGFIGSAVYSGMETGAYTLNRVRLQVLADRGQRTALALRRLVDKPATLLATLLVGNNVANYLGTAGLAVILESMALSEWQSIVLNTLIVTPLLFVFGETLPKDTMAAHSDRLMPPLTPVLTGSRWLFTITGLVPLIGLFSAGVLKMLGQPGKDRGFPPRKRVEMLVREGVGHGILSDEQSAIVDRVLRLGGRTVRQEMVAWGDVLSVKVNDPPSRLWELAQRSSRSRYPVTDAQGKVVGLIDVFDALLHGQADCPPIRELMTEPYTLTPEMPLRQALQHLQTHSIAIAVVADAQRPVGVVTVKDLVEPITGDLRNW